LAFQNVYLVDFLQIIISIFAWFAYPYLEFPVSPTIIGSFLMSLASKAGWVEGMNLRGSDRDIFHATINISGGE